MDKNNNILKINASNLINNYKKIQALVGTNIIVAPAVKADSYGISAPLVASCLNAYCKNFFVANIKEAIELRESHISGNIYSLYVNFDQDIDNLIKYRISPVISTFEDLVKFAKIIILDKNVPVAFHFDTGINRYGIHAFDHKASIDIIKTLSCKYQTIIIMSHLSDADNELDSSFSEKQLADFLNIKQQFKDQSFLYSLANSAGTFLGKQYHFDMVRPGLCIYGGNPLKNNKDSQMNNVVNITSKIIQIKEIQPLEFVGYNNTYQALTQTLVATIPVGYFDGIPRSNINDLYVAIGGTKCKVIGRVSMDFITVDITNLEDHLKKVNTPVEILGDNISIDQYAEMSNRSPYEIITSIGKRYKKILA
jgi:alanine racemase